jgi:hypothetical protein
LPFCRLSEVNPWIAFSGSFEYKMISPDAGLSEMLPAKTDQIIKRDIKGIIQNIFLHVLYDGACAIICQTDKNHIGSG